MIWQLSVKSTKHVCLHRWLGDFFVKTQTPISDPKNCEELLGFLVKSKEMANNDNFEPMQVDAAEENDNDGDIGVAFQQQMDGGGIANEGSAGGGFGGPGSLQAAGNFQRGDIYGENSRVNYNIENPSIDLEAYAQGYSGLAAIYRLRFIAHHCPVLRVKNAIFFQP